ncbi:hypothetical protein C7974DRAFT_312693 [Boeremia exigua]|uniref:uncharacterized protein n=1 Tax=Boeremia exigua TaxID=749465 RepID=UPI001E8DC0CD|nr:uncharacterized protein C7974DRAFT_312693 [Boeremia exigua]KAH6625597.1 hypothetical protein C7974DRAFT_312693 [Boeremia exigua]
MSKYVDASSQTEWAGLMQKNIVRPEALFAPAPIPDTSTPPAEPLTNKEQCVADLPTISPAEQRGQPHTPPQSNNSSQGEVPAMSTSPLLARRQNRPDDFVPYLNLPAPDLPAIAPSPLDNQAPMSPPPSALPLSPVPEANRRFAGHTPLYAGSPLQEMRQPPDADTEPQMETESQSTTPQRDVGLTGPLSLAANPGDGSQDTILLSALDEELERVAREQARVDGTADVHRLPSRQGSADSRSSDVQPVDGVILKKTVPMNFGAPMGEV